MTSIRCDICADDLNSGQALMAPRSGQVRSLQGGFVRKSRHTIALLADQLRMNPLLARLSNGTLVALAEHTRLTRFAANECLFMRGDEIRFAGVILRGGLRNSLTGADGHELSMSVQRRGAFYGWIGLLSPSPSPWDILAQGPTEMACFQVRDFRALMQDRAELVAMVAHALSARLHRAYGHMSNLILDTIDVRLRRTLVMLVGDRTRFAPTDTPSIRITQETLGSFVQCSRPTVNRLLKDLEAQGLIRLGYGEIIIPDLQALFPSSKDEVFSFF
ncbi:MAG: hypothetical protein CMH66_01925 [Nioella sp.]|nr:hypothetical protein [Nioella sp.]